MSIKQNGGVFGRNPTFNDVTIEGDLIINGEVFTGLDFQGSWNASTNSPALASSVGTNGEFYIVSVAGTTDLNGITNWGIGDWAIFNGTAWQRVEGGADGNFNDLTANSLTVSTLEIAKNDQTNGATVSITNSFEGSGWTAGDTIGSIDFRVDDASSTEKVRGQIKVFDDAAGGSTYPYANAMSFSTSYFATLSEHMRISSNGSVGIGTSSPSASALLDVQSTTKGVRFPNMTTTQKNAMADVAGMQVYDTTLNKMCFNTGSAWETITSS